MKSAVDSESAAQAQRSNKGREQTNLKAYIDEELDYYREEVKDVTDFWPRGSGSQRLNGQ